MLEIFMDLHFARISISFFFFSFAREICFSREQAYRLVVFESIKLIKLETNSFRNLINLHLVFCDYRSHEKLLFILKLI